MEKKGFTLIELLVVIGIIGIIAGFSAINLAGVRQHGRDAERKADLKTIQSAFELFRADQRRYPTAAEFGVICNAALTTGCPGASCRTYIETMPCDPLDTTTRYTYQQPTPQTYILWACLETLNDQQKDGGSAGTDNGPVDRCPAVGRASITVTNP